MTYAVAVWLTNDLSASGLGIVPAAVLAAALVWYFEWRSELRRRILSDSRGLDRDSETCRTRKLNYGGAQPVFERGPDLKTEPVIA